MISLSFVNLFFVFVFQISGSRIRVDERLEEKYASPSGFGTNFKNSVKPVREFYEIEAPLKIVPRFIIFKVTDFYLFLVSVFRCDKVKVFLFLNKSAAGNAQCVLTVVIPLLIFVFFALIRNIDACVGFSPSPPSKVNHNPLPVPKSDPFISFVYHLPAGKI